MKHTFPLRVYYEDTDLAGVVYYAAYLKFIERARTECIEEHDIDQVRLKEKDGIVFAVRRVVADYLLPARFRDHLLVETKLREITASRLILGQRVLRDDTVLFGAEVTLVALNRDGRPVRLPADVRRAMGDLPE